MCIRDRYTAVTRAKERLIILGQPRAIEEMVANDRKTVRYTNLKVRNLEQQVRSADEILRSYHHERDQQKER